MTVSDPVDPALPDQPQASLRVELLGKIVGAQFDIESAIAELSRSGASTAALADQLVALGRLQQQIAVAGPSTLQALRAEIVATVAATQAATQLGRATTDKADAASLADAAAASRDQVAGVMRDMHKFDPYLQFASAYEETAYRQREAERRAIIAAEQAKGTPTGDLNAAGAAVGQMADAKAHGAGDSPEFQQRWDELVKTTENLRAAARAKGIPTEEFDNHLREDLRRILKSKGLSDAEIDARFAANPDPLDAVKAYVAGDEDLSEVSRSARKAIGTDAAVAKDASTDDRTMDDAMAKLRTSGVVAAIASEGYDNGVAARPVQGGRQL